MRIGSLFIFWPWYKLPTHIRVRKALEEMGIVYIKFAQHCATFTEIFDTETVKELSKMQTNVKPYHAKTIINIIKDNLGNLFDNLEHIDPNYIGSASIAQVHKASLVLNDKRIEVAIKVIKPNVEKMYKKDIKFLYLVAKVLTRLSKQFFRLNLVNLVKIFETCMLNELNLLIEAASMDEMRECKIPNLVIPKVYWHFSNEKVLVMDYIRGISIREKEQLIANNCSIKEIISNLTTIFFYQAYEYGFFHGDLHPGNLLVLQNNKIAMIDFGIVGHISKKDKFVIAQTLHSFLEGNYFKIGLIHKFAGYLNKDIDLHDFAKSMRTIGECLFNKELKDISIGILLKRLFSVGLRFDMELQPQLILVQKTTLSMERLIKHLDPNANPYVIAKPWIRAWSIRNMSYFAILKEKIGRKYQKTFGLEGFFKQFD